MRGSRRLSRFSVALLLIQGCGAPVAVDLSSQVTIHPPRTDLQDPDSYRVDAADNSSYRSTANITLPRPWHRGRASYTEVVEILPTDIWKLTHRVGSRGLVFSGSFQRRQCEQILSHGESAGAHRYRAGGCEANYLYHLLMSESGMPTGWILLHNPARVVARRDRYVDLDPAAHEDPSWPPVRAFEKIR